MAVQNKWINADVEAGRYGNAASVAGNKVLSIAVTFEVAAADDDASIFKLAKLPSNAIPVRADIMSDALTAGTDWDLGFYTEAGVAADANVLADAVDLSSGVTLPAAANNGLSDMGIENVGKKVWELLGKTITNKEEGYVLALTANTIGSAAGTVSVIFQYILG